MKPATQLILTLSAIATFTAAPAAIVWAIDPLHIYRPKADHPVGLYHLPRHQNAGLIRSYLANPDFGFDTVVMGTSLSQNFAPSRVQQTLGSGGVIKMAMAGSMPPTQLVVMRRVLQEDTIKRVIWEINDRTYAWLPIDKINTNHTFPAYLYSGGLDLYKYVFNIDYLRIALEQAGLIEPESSWRAPQGDDWATWHRSESQWRNFRRKHWDKNIDTYRAEVEKQRFGPFPTIDALYDVHAPPGVYTGVDQVAEIVRLHPEVKFEFFVPPISIAFYAYKDLDEFVVRFGMTRYLLEQIASFPNARVFAFNDMSEIVMDLSFYRDLAHFHPNINCRIMEYIARGEHELTLANIDVYEAVWFTLVRSFGLSDLMIDGS